FSGYVDLVDDRGYTFDDRSRARETPVPEAMTAEIERAHSALIDAAAESDDALLEKYLEGTELTDDEVRAALHAATANGMLVPVVCAAASSEQGAALLLDSLVRYLPAPAERVHKGVDAKGNEAEIACDPAGKLCAQVFKTTVDTFGKVSYFKVLRGSMRGDSHPVTVRLGVEERFAQLGQPNGKAIVTVPEVIAGDIGVVTKLTHTETGDTLCAKDAPITQPPIVPPPASYAAAIVARSKGDEDKITSGLSRLAEEDIAFTADRDPVTNEVLVHGLGDVHLDVALERLKRKYGVDATLQPPRIPYRETITGTARVAHKYKKQSGGGGLYGDATIVPERFTGDVMGLLNSKRGRVAGMNPLGDGRAEVGALLPQSEMHTFPIELRAMTQGRGRYSMSFSNYEEVPAHVAQKLIEAHAKEHATAAV